MRGGDGSTDSGDVRMSRPPQEDCMKKLASLAAVGMLAASAQAATITENLSFSLSGFVDISGDNLPPPDRKSVV